MSSTAPQWHNLSTAAEVVEQAAGKHDELHGGVRSDTSSAEAHEVLLRVTSAGRHLAALLDDLADQYGAIPQLEPTALSVALDQAAAAAADMAACTSFAARSLDGADERPG